MVVLLTAATAFAAYQSAITGIQGDDLDFEAQRTLTAATASFLNGNAELIQNLQAYGAYRTDLAINGGIVYGNRSRIMERR